MKVQAIPNESEYFSKEMKNEFHVQFAKREASRILRRVEYHKLASLLEKHVNLKYTKEIVGS